MFSGPKLAKPIKAAQMVVKEHSTVLLGGDDGTSSLSDMYELTCEFGTCYWTTMSQKLQEPRQDFVAMIIPDEMANCEN